MQIKTKTKLLQDLRYAQYVLQVFLDQENEKIRNGKGSLNQGKAEHARSTMLDIIKEIKTNYRKVSKK